MCFMQSEVWATIFNFVFLAPTGALEEGILSVRPSVCPDFPQKNIEKEL